MHGRGTKGMRTGSADLVARDVAVVVDVVAGLGAQRAEHVVLVGVLGQRVPSVGAQAGVDPGGHLAPPPLALPVVLPLPGRRVPQRRREAAAPAAAPAPSGSGGSGGSGRTCDWSCTMAP